MNSNHFRNYITKTGILASFISLMFLFISCNYTEKTFDLKSGDLLFNVGAGNSDFTSAIQKSTSKKDEIPYALDTAHMYIGKGYDSLYNETPVLTPQIWQNYKQLT